MFLKHGASLYNLDRLVRIRLDGRTLCLHDIDVHNSLVSITLKSPSVASFAYGRIIHGILNQWRCVDVTENKIEELMEKVRLKGESPAQKSPLPEIPLDNPTTGW